MDSSFADIIEELVRYRDEQYRDDNQRAEARLEAIEFALQRALEKLRDIHDKK